MKNKYSGYFGVFGECGEESSGHGMDKQGSLCCKLLVEVLNMVDMERRSGTSSGKGLAREFDSGEVLGSRILEWEREGMLESVDERVGPAAERC